jgi:hypothetical protein
MPADKNKGAPMSKPGPTTIPDAPPELSLPERRCVPCRGGVPPLDEEAQRVLLAELDAIGRGWRIEGGRHLQTTTPTSCCAGAGSRSRCSPTRSTG